MVVDQTILVYFHLLFLFLKMSQLLANTCKLVGSTLNYLQIKLSEKITPIFNRYKTRSLHKLCFSSILNRKIRIYVEICSPLAITKIIRRKMAS